MKPENKTTDTAVPSVDELTGELNREKYRSRYKKLLRSTIYTLVIVAAISVLVATLLLPVLQIFGTSMNPNLQEEDIVVSVKSPQFKTGDIIAFYYNNHVLVKRIIGCPGDNVVITDSENGESKSYLIPYGFREIVKEGDHVTKGQALTDGAPNPHDVLAIRGVSAVHDYLIREVQKTYRTQGVDINDKHIEVIVRQMMRKVKIEDAGETDFLPGSIVEKHEFYTANEKAKAKAEADGREPNYATCVPTLMGITKASLATESFLSAASFQETTRVLTDAAIKGKTDPLLGLKENVIIGKLLPSGTGMKCYSDVELRPTEEHTATVLGDLLKNV